MHTMKIRILSFCLLIMLLMSGAASAAPMTAGGSDAATSEGTVASSYPANEVAAGHSPTTGLPTTQTSYKPIMVQISNSAEARPHWNMSEADIVYEMIYWGPAHTRYSAIYNDVHPEMVGSIRSARVANCAIRQEWDCPLVFFGGQNMEGTSIYDFFRDYNVPTSFRFDGTGGGKGFSRVEERKNPHDAVAHISEMVNNYWPTNDDGSAYEPRVHAFRFSDQPTQGADTADEIHVVYEQSDYYPSYKYNPTERVYERWYNGAEQVDGLSGKRIVASNVIVQFCKLTFFNSSKQRPVIETVGKGAMDAFIDGRHTRGSWVRNSMDDRTVFVDMNGEEITFLPGKTFIQIIPMSSSFTYVRDDGTPVTMDFGAEVAAPEYDPAEPDDDIDNMEANTEGIDG